MPAPHRQNSFPIALPGGSVHKAGSGERAADVPLASDSTFGLPTSQLRKQVPSLVMIFLE